MLHLLLDERCLVALSDIAKVAKRDPLPRRSVKAETNRHWSDSQKIEAVTTYLALGTVTLTAAVLKIPEYTVRNWKGTEWWKKIADELAIQENLQLSARMKRLMETTMSQTEDRALNGDFIYDSKIGELVRKPVNMKDLHKVTMDLVDKRLMLDGRVPAGVSVEHIDAKLQKLADSFAALAAPKPKSIEVTDVIYATEDASGGAGTGVRGRADPLGDGEHLSTVGDSDDGDRVESSEEITETEPTT